MRCYFIKDKHFVSFATLTATNEANLIAEAKELFERNGKPRDAEGFEVWDGSRRLYRYPEEKMAQTTNTTMIAAAASTVNSSLLID